MFEAQEFRKINNSTAMRVHAVPRADFERQVESDNPPTITELARQGTKHQPIAPVMLDGRDPLGAARRARKIDKEALRRKAMGTKPFDIVVDPFAGGGLWGDCKLGWGLAVACRFRIIKLVPPKVTRAMNSAER